MACERNHIELTEHALQMKYLDIIPSECAVHLSDSIRTEHAGGWTFEKMMKEIEDYFEVRTAYEKNDGGMTRQRNRATWANDTKMLRAAGEGSPPAHVGRRPHLRQVRRPAFTPSGEMPQQHR